MTENTKECPCCENHCSSMSLRCHRGEDYFRNAGLEYKRKEGGHHHRHRETHD